MSPESARKLIFVLGMHRSGTSLVTQLLAGMGMSLGPFPLVPGDQHNTDGYFESQPLAQLDRYVLQQVWGFTGDMPATRQKLRQICDAEGRWPESVDWGKIPLDLGIATLRGLIESAEISGFKDPRAALAWPFWERALEAFPGLRIIPVIVLRSPHEIAMSLFMRSNGMVDYWDALEMTAVCFQRMEAIAGGFSARATIRFGTGQFEQDMREAAHTIGLSWDAAIFQRIVKPAHIHQKPARLHHIAQTLYDQLAGIAPSPPTADDIEVMRTDSQAREDLLRNNARLAHGVAMEGERLVVALREELKERQNRSGG